MEHWGVIFWLSEEMLFFHCWLHVWFVWFQLCLNVHQMLSEPRFEQRIFPVHCNCQLEMWWLCCIYQNRKRSKSYKYFDLNNIVGEHKEVFDTCWSMSTQLHCADSGICNLNGIFFMWEISGTISFSFKLTCIQQNTIHILLLTSAGKLSIRITRIWCRL